MYIGKEHYCHSAVVARISIYGERVRYFIKTEPWQQRFLRVERQKETLLPQQCGSKGFKCIETVSNVIVTSLW